MAGPNKRGRKADPDPVVAPAPTPPPPAPTLTRPLFDGPLPLDIGPAVPGLANRSAQNCRACHPIAHDGWAAGPHGRPVSPEMLAAVDQAAISACATCHRPLADQHDEAPSWTRTDAPGPPNPAWDGTLRTEGVTCASCHVREGRIAVATEDVARRTAPHPMAYAPDLTDERACAACHQLTWPGADVPLYDTVGEWSRSAWKAAAVGCVDCHWSGITPHEASPSPARAWSLIVRPERRRIVRGDTPWTVAITLQNTGAGHAMPSGSPFRGYRLTAKVVKAGEQEAVSGLGELVTDLTRSLANDPPYATIADTRLPAGGERSWSYKVTFPTKLPAGRYDLVVALQRTLKGTAVASPVVEQRVDLLVQ